MNKNLIFGAGIAALVVLCAVGGSVANQAAFANKGGFPDEGANRVATGSGATGNQEHFATCKEFSTASECAHSPVENGKFISQLAHSVNGPP